MAYLILANLSLILFFAVYFLILKRLTFFQWNRIYLMSAVVISFAMPLLQFVDLSQHKEVYQPLTVLPFSEAEPLVISYKSGFDKFWSAMDWMWFIYLVGAGLMLGWLCQRLYIALRVSRKRTDEPLAFSFFSWIQVNKEADGHDVMTAHELVHVRQGHSYDILLLEICRVFNWFNPVFHFYLKELKFQHECIADQACAKDKVTYAELLVANAMHVSRGSLLHKFSNSSLLKQRVIMLFKNKSKKINKTKYILALPLLLWVSGMALAFNTSIVSSAEPSLFPDKYMDNMRRSDTTATDTSIIIFLKPRLTLV